MTRLAERLGQLEQRIPGLSLPSAPPSWPLGESSFPTAPARGGVTQWVTLLGRSCLVLGGAFLIRALTDGRVLPGSLGAGLGIVFAATWIFFAHRAAARGEILSASFHAAIAALIAYPLVLESTTRLGVMSPPVAALTLIAFTGLLLVAAWRDERGWLAWVGVLSCLVTGVALLRATPGRSELIGVLLLLVAATFFWLGDRWPALRWAPAVLVDLVVLRAIQTSTPPVLLPALGLAGLSLGLVLYRTAGLGRPVGAFEALQTVLGLLLGTAGALQVTRQAGWGPGAVAGAVLAASLVTMAFAGRIVPRRGNRDLDFVFYAALSLGLLASGVALISSGALRGVLWSALSFGAVLAGRRSHPVALWSLAALLALGGARSSELLAGGVSPGSIVVLGLIIVAYLATFRPIQPSVPAAPARAISRLPSALLLLVASVGVAALLLHASHVLTADEAHLATARTVVIVGIALALALVRRRVELPELTWIACLALVLGGVELLVVQLSKGRASTLLVSFVLYGAALILVPRIAPFGRDFLSPSRPR